MDLAPLIWPPPFDDNVKRRAVFFIVDILKKDVESGRILYRNINYIPSRDMYALFPPPSFKALAHISEHLRNGGFFDTFQDATSYVLSEGVVQKIRTGIADFISRLDQCIQYVQGRPIGELEPYLTTEGTTLPIFQGQSTLREHSTRNSTRESTWNSYVLEWDRALTQWRGYLVLFDNIYPKIFRQDMLDAMVLIVNTYPTFFWYEFWEWTHNSNDRFNNDGFHELLVHGIAPLLIQHSPVQKQYSRDALQEVIRKIQLREQNGSSERLESILSERRMNEALDKTGMILMPHPDSLGEITRSAMNMDGYGGQNTIFFK
jgi:hypothetical protein